MESEPEDLLTSLHSSQVHVPTLFPPFPLLRLTDSRCSRRGRCARVTYTHTISL